MASRSVSIEKQVAMVLFTVACTASNQDFQDRFQHSGETVSRYFHAVLNAINRIVPKYIQSPSTSEIPIAITSNSKFYNFFNHCIGALDGTHIAAKVPEDEAAAFRNRKGHLSPNVLACYEFDDLRFTYVFAGWEGPAHDGAVFGRRISCSI
jgi:DDE superfamily endonuclease